MQAIFNSNMTTFKKYEHKSCDVDPSRVDDYINEKGNDGWCLVGIIREGDYFKVFMVKQRYDE